MTITLDKIVKSRAVKITLVGLVVTAMGMAYCQPDFLIEKGIIYDATVTKVNCWDYEAPDTQYPHHWCHISLDKHDGYFSVVDYGIGENLNEGDRLESLEFKTVFLKSYDKITAYQKKTEQRSLSSTER